MGGGEIGVEEVEGLLACVLPGRVVLRAEASHELRRQPAAEGSIEWLQRAHDDKAFFEGIVNGEPDPIELLRAGDEPAVLELIAVAQREHGATPA